MELLKAALLGIIQGLTEFLPISSSGHLALAKKISWFDIFADPHLSKMFDVALHGGTLIALVIYFRSDLARLLKDNVYRRLVVPVLVATLVVLLIGKYFEEPIEQRLNISLLIASLIILFGIILWIADRNGKQTRDLSQAGRWDAILMTCSQVIALIPGVSRSGITMTVGLLRHLTRETVVRISFLLSIPVVAAPPLYFALQVARHKETLVGNEAGMIIVGVITAGISGYLAIGYLLKLVQTKSFTPFVVYRVLLGIAMMVMVWAGWAMR